MSRCPVGPVRQNSLQQPPPSRQQPIRRQRSSKDERILHMYSTNAVGTRNRYADNANKCDHTTLTRPKVRVAWGEQPVKLKNDNVEIVARQIPTGKSSRSTTGRNSRDLMSKCPMGEKATILYSRQELAERLRIAWRQREENKSNIDIFLAHNTIEERSDSRLSSETNHTNLATPKIQEKNDDSNKVEEPIEKTNENNAEEHMERELEFHKPNLNDAFLTVNLFTPLESEKSTLAIAKKINENYADSKVGENKNEELTEQQEEKEENSVVEKKSCIHISCNNWNTSKTMDTRGENPIENPLNNKVKTPTLIKDPDNSQARLKRAGYQSGMNKAFVNPVTERSSTPQTAGRVNAIQEYISRYRRTNSAPPQHRTQVNIVIDTTGITATNDQSDKLEQTQPILKNSIVTRRPIKSAPLAKRRSKVHKRRGLTVSYSKDGEDEDNENSKGKTKGNKSSKNLLESKSNDVVTMVSLISSADSESEIDENSSRNDKLICELRNKLPTASIIKSSSGVSDNIRKPLKSCIGSIYVLC